MTFGIPMLIGLGFGVIEIGNMINSYLVLTHLTREATNIASRQPGVKGSTQWTTSLNADLNAVISKASPVINPTGSGAKGPNQYKIYYSLVEWNPTPGVCGGDPIANGQPDNYRISPQQYGLGRQYNLGIWFADPEQQPGQ